MNVELLRGDCREVLKSLTSDSVDSVVTDPPYDLTADKKGGSGPASVNLNSPHGRARITTGFMGKSWDGTGVAFDSTTWVEVLRVLKPGGYLLAFGGSRTYHRMACAVEAAGFEIRDQIMWLYGSGFPKSLDVQRSIDTSLCVMPGRHYWAESSLPKNRNSQPDDHVCPFTDEGQEHVEEGTALKPAHEPIVMARKPLIGTVAANVLQHGTGALNIDGCRIEGVDGSGHWSGDDGSDQTSRPGYEGGFTRGGAKADGRWPANIIHDGSEEVLTAFPDAPGQQRYVGPEHGERPSRGIYGDFGARPRNEPRLDSGSAARFYYCAKASQEDRDEGLEEFQRRQRDAGRKEGNPGGDNPRNRGLTPRTNHHPTVKPTDLMRYLCRLVTPPHGIVLDPFMGSGSTGKAAILEGLSFIGIELSAEYCELAEKRIEAASTQGNLFA